MNYILKVGFDRRDDMNRERALQILLVLLGLFFVAGVYPLMTSVRSAWQANNEDALPMMLSLYVTLGVFVCWQRITHRRIAA